MVSTRIAVTSTAGGLLSWITRLADLAEPSIAPEPGDESARGDHEVALPDPSIVDDRDGDHFAHHVEGSNETVSENGETSRYGTGHDHIDSRAEISRAVDLDFRRAGRGVRRDLGGVEL